MKKIYFLLIAISMFAYSANAQSVTNAEYFFDSDPGFGNGAQITITPADSITVNNLPISISGLTLGYHWLYMRVKDSVGSWSFHKSIRYYIYDSSPITPINDSVYLVQAEYFVDATPSPGNGTLINLPHQDTVNYLSPFVGFPVDTNCHTISLMVKDNLGNWSHPKYGINAPVAQFDSYVSGYDVILVNNSYNHQSTHWDFNDGDTTNQFSPVHHFDSAGVYNVCLTESNNCQQTPSIVCKSVTVKGVNTISPTSGGNIGTVTMTITGAGFTNNTTVKLVRQGEADILPLDSSINVLAGIRIELTFELDNVAIGNWDIYIEVPGDTSYLLINGFKIDSSYFIKPSITMLGPSNFRNNRWTTFSFNITNLSNNDIYYQTVYIAIPDDLMHNLRNELASVAYINPDFDTLPYYVVLDSFMNSGEKFKLIGLLIPTLAPFQSYQVLLGIKSSHSHSFKIYYWLASPMYKSYANYYGKSRGFCSIDAGCCNGLSIILTTAAAVAAGPGAPAAAWIVGCLSSQLCTVWQSSFNSNCRPNNKDPLPIIRPIAGMLISCFLGFNLPLVAIGKAVSGMALGSGGNCTACICPPPPPGPGGSTSSGSDDPNDKYGITGVSGSKYTNSKFPLNYSIRFENVDTATAPAQTVIITDTLDNTNLDLTTFQLTSFGFADTIIAIPSGRKSYTTDIDLQPNLPLIARVTAYLNDSTHVLTAKYESLDPLTMKPTEDALLGFLLPNDSTGRGEGFISYSIKAKDSVATGTVINNMATIYFDENAPINTPVWTNIIDDLKPQSQVDSLTTNGIDSIFVHWSGVDNGPATVYAYNVYYNKNGGEWTLWKYNSSLTNDVFIGEKDTTYGFYSVAIDSATNVEIAPSVADKTITLSTPLPIVIKNFFLNEYNCSAFLSWATSQESNTSHIDIYRTTTNTNGFQKIATVQSAGQSSQEKMYSYIDKDVKDNTSYEYQLQFADIDARVSKSDSKTITLDCSNASSSIHVFPNPAKNELNVLYVTESNNAEIELEIYDLTGRKMLFKSQSLNNGGNLITFDISKLSNGIYFLHYKDIDSMESGSVKFEKR